MTTGTPAPGVVVFDLGGVLLDWDPRHLYRQLFDDPEEMEAFLEEVDFAEWNARQDAGRPWREAVEDLATRFPEHRTLIEAFHARWPETVAGAIPGTVEVLRELHDAGVRLLALSNWSSETFALTAGRFEFLGLFEGIVISGEVGAVKPGRRIFEVLMVRHGVDPADAVFIDDSPTNIEAARQLGFRCIRFTGAPELRVALADLGLPIAPPAERGAPSA